MALGTNGKKRNKGLKILQNGVHSGERPPSTSGTRDRQHVLRSCGLFWKELSAGGRSTYLIPLVDFTIAGSADLLGHLVAGSLRHRLGARHLLQLALQHTDIHGTNDICTAMTN
jgi:hypothetical protein